MAKYTVTLIEYKNEFDLKINDLFPDTYDFYDNDRRSDFERKFFDTYFDREIGFETYSIFKHKLKAKLNNIMPYYKMLYETERAVIDPLSEFEYTETYDKGLIDNVSTSGESTAKSDYDNTNKNSGELVSSDTPQDYLGSKKLNHASQVDLSNDQNVSSQKGKTDNISKSKTDRDSSETLKRNVKGRKSKTQMELLNEYRKLWINIDTEIIKECEVLFMGVF